LVRGGVAETKAKESRSNVTRPTVRCKRQICFPSKYIVDLIGCIGWRTPSSSPGPRSIAKKTRRRSKVVMFDDLRFLSFGFFGHLGFPLRIKGAVDLCPLQPFATLISTNTAGENRTWRVVEWSCITTPSQDGWSRN
jgi:hypothetical protein